MENAHQWLHEALDKAQRYCAYSDRCSNDLREKFMKWEFPKDGFDAVLKIMKEEGFIDDARYAKVFARSKNRQNVWGKNKIRSALKFKRIPEDAIIEALAEINGDDYYERLKKQMTAKVRTEKEKDPYKRKAKLIRFGMSKGYENDLIMEAINEVDK